MDNKGFGRPPIIFKPINEAEFNSVMESNVEVDDDLTRFGSCFKIKFPINFLPSGANCQFVGFKNKFFYINLKN